jgi:hypothetical protein
MRFTGDHFHDHFEFLVFFFGNHSTLVGLNNVIDQTFNKKNEIEPKVRIFSNTEHTLLFKNISV